MRRFLVRDARGPDGAVRLAIDSNSVFNQPSLVRGSHERWTRRLRTSFRQGRHALYFLRSPESRNEHVALLCPLLDPQADPTSTSQRCFAKGYFLESNFLEWFRSLARDAFGTAFSACGVDRAWVATLGRVPETDTAVKQIVADAANWFGDPSPRFAHAPPREIGVSVLRQSGGRRTCRPDRSCRSTLVKAPSAFRTVP
jgi:hypothetical protein